MDLSKTNCYYVGLDKIKITQKGNNFYFNFKENNASDLIPDF